MSTVVREREPGPAPEEQVERVRRPHLVPEFLLVAAVYIGYTLGRAAATAHPNGSYVHAQRVWDLERWLHLPNEASVQRAVLGSARLMDLANLHYQVGYVLSVVGSLVWLYIWHPEHYLWYRRFLTLVTFVGLVGHIVFPMAPPRLLAGDNVVDSAKVFGHAVYGPVGTGLSNQFAAMPSLHVGWAVVCAVGVIAVLRTPWRWLAVLHPIITTIVVVITGNHFWMDGIVATVIVAVSALVAAAWLPEGKPAYAT